MTHVENIETQICSSFLYFEAKKQENQKLFPFYVFTNFNKAKCHEGSNNQFTYYEVLKCDYCNRHEETNSGGYYTMYIIFESHTDIRPACSLNCRKGRIYAYYDQIYGFRDPLNLSIIANSIKHSMAAWLCIGTSTSYAYRKYIFSGVTWKDILETSKFSESSGSTHFMVSKNIYWINWINGKLHIRKKGVIGKTIVTMTKPDIVKHMNEILIANREGQLDFFNNYQTA